MYLSLITDVAVYIVLGILLSDSPYHYGILAVCICGSIGKIVWLLQLAKEYKESLPPKRKRVKKKKDHTFLRLLISIVLLEASFYIVILILTSNGVAVPGLVLLIGASLMAILGIILTIGV